MFYMPKLQSTFQKSHLQYIIWSQNKWRNKRTNHLQFKQNYCGLYKQLGTTFTTKARYTNTQSSILIHSKWQKKHSSTNSENATSTPTKTEQVSSGLHSVAAAADDDMSCQVLALSRNILPFIIRGGYCKSGMTKPTTSLCYSVQSTLLCNCHTSGSWLFTICHCQSQTAAVIWPRLCLQKLGEDLI